MLNNTGSLFFILFTSIINKVTRVTKIKRITPIVNKIESYRDDMMALSDILIAKHPRNNFKI